MTDAITAIRGRSERCGKPSEDDEMSAFQRIYDAKSLPEIIDLLNPEGRFLRLERDLDDDSMFYGLYQLDQQGRSMQVDAFVTDDPAREAIEKCGYCSNFSRATGDGLAYGPFCSTYSLAKNLEDNERRIAQRKAS